MRFIICLLFSFALQAENLGTIRDFSFPDKDNKIFSSTSLDNQIWIMNVFFADCEAVCPIVNGYIAKLDHNFNQKENFKILSFSIDLENDTPKNLQTYAKRFNASTNWNFLRPDPEELKKILVEDLKIGSFADKSLHSTRIILFKGKEILGYFQGLDPESISKLEAELNVLLN